MNRGQASDAILDSGLPAFQKLILLGYMKHFPSDRAVESGTAYLGASTLAAYVGCGLRTVKDHRGKLIASGVLVVTETLPGGVFRIRFDLTKLPPGKRAKAGPTVGGAVDAPVQEMHPCSSRTGGVQQMHGGSAVDARGGVQELHPNPPPTTLLQNPPPEPVSAPPPEPPAPPSAPTQVSLVAPAPCPAADPASVTVEPLWKRRGLPAPSKTVAAKKLTAEVLDVWAHWAKRCDQSSLKRAPSRIALGDVDAIRFALKMCGKADAIAIIDYAFLAPADFDGFVASWRDSPKYLRPETLFRRTKLDRNVENAAGWAEQRGASRGPGGGPGGGEPASDRLASAWIAQDRAAIDRVLAEIGVSYREAHPRLNRVAPQGRLRLARPGEIPGFHKALRPVVRELARGAA